MNLLTIFVLLGKAVIATLLILCLIAFFVWRSAYEAARFACVLIRLAFI